MVTVNFTEGMGMLVGKEDLGFGKRSWRYSMLVKNGVRKMLIEPNEPGDPSKVSDADTMIKYLKPDWTAKNRPFLYYHQKLAARSVRKQKVC